MMTSQDDLQNNKKPSRLDKAGWILFAVCILGIMIQIDFTAVNVALVDISHTLHTGLSTVQWALSAYVLAWGAFVLTAGRLADLFGKRRTFLTGTILFMLGSALTGAAFQAWFLIFGRIIQGIGGALFLPGLYTLVFTAYPENKRGSALGILTSAIALGLAIGPTFGGVVSHVLNWRWIFFLNLPLGVPVLAIIFWAVQKEPWRVLEESMDYIGAVLIITALLTLMLTLDHTLAWGIFSTQFLFSLLITLILITLFIFYELRQEHPLIQLSMFQNQSFLGCSLSYIFMGFNFSTILIISNLYLQNALDYSPLATGFIFLIMTVMFALLSIFSGKLADRMDPRIPIVAGGLTMVVSLLIFSFCTQHSSLWLTITALAFAGMGVGLGFPALNATMLKSVNQNLLSTASSVFAMFGCLGNTMGLIFGSVIIVNFGQKKLAGLLAEHSYSFTPDQQQVLNSVIGSTHYSPSQLTQFPQQSISELMDILRSAFVHAMSITMWAALLLTILAIIISVVLIKPKKDAPSIQQQPY